MYSIAFPNIFNGSTIKLYKDEIAVKSNLRNLLGANRGGLFGDPHFGTALKQILWDQAHPDVARELIRDEVYEAILSYMPQTTIDRDAIGVEIEDNVVKVTIRALNDLGIYSNLLEISLLTDSDKS